MKFFMVIGKYITTKNRSYKLSRSDFLELWLPVLVWCGLIFYVSSLPQISTGITTWDFIFTKAAHMVEYFILALFLYRAFKGSFNPVRFYLILWPFTLSSLYAVSDEIHQFFVPTRLCSLEDIIVDIIGITAFFIYQYA